MTRGNLQGHAWLGNEGQQLFINNVSTPFLFMAQAVDSFGFPSRISALIPGAPVGAVPLRYEDNYYHPTLMDGFDYPINNGEQLQENLGGPQFVVPGTTHAQEVRIRSQQ